MSSVKPREKKRPLVLIIDDEVSICDSLAGVLSDEGWGTISALNGQAGLVEFKLHQPDLVFLDVWMPGLDGIETMQQIKAMNREIPIIIMSGHGTIETAVRATKLGAFDFIEKPMSIDKVLPLAEQIAAKRIEKLSSPIAKVKKLDLIGSSPSMQPIQRQLNIVAPRYAWVLITGENGTGKEVLAMNLHAHSSRADKPFVAVNCAAIPEELIESELFGHEKGAFTGAVSSQKGRFEQASGGTLFLDEIADMSLRTQAKILRVLQERSFERLGSEETIKVDVRVIAATNKNLEEAIGKGEFREDLFYRLNVVPFHLPPLRERIEDLEDLTKHFLKIMSFDLKEPEKVMEPDVLLALKHYPWPGNIRELRNLIERLCIMVPGNTITRSDLPDHVVFRSDPTVIESRNEVSTLREAKSDFERAFILDKLQENQWNVSKTAEAIGIERSNLHRKLKSFNIDPKQLKD
jgi:two-component system nitrogen regulation response regulator NtrX